MLGRFSPLRYKRWGKKGRLQLEEKKTQHFAVNSLTGDCFAEERKIDGQRRRKLDCSKTKRTGRVGGSV